MSEMKVNVGVSNRHVHLTKEDLETLYGKGYELTKKKELSQPGQFAAEECVTLVGPKRSIEKVRILGPIRPETQIEISRTDMFTLVFYRYIWVSRQMTSRILWQLSGKN